MLSEKIHAQEKSRYDAYKKLLTQENGKILYAGKLLQRAARLCPTATALIYKNARISYQQLYDDACACGIFLQEQGIRPGDKVVIWYGNCPEFYTFYYGAWQIGAIVVPLNFFLTESEFLYIMGDCTPACTVIAPDCWEKISLEEQKKLTGLIITGDTLKKACETRGYPIFHECDPSVLSVLLYTSGTTGKPKGVMLSSENIMTNLIQAVIRINLTGTGRVLGVLPLFHSFAQLACVWGALFLCCTVILVPKIARSTLVEGFMHEPTHVIGVPALYGLLCLLRTMPMGNVHYFISGGDAMPDKIALSFELLYRRRICAGYGLTECSPFVAADFTDTLYRSDCVGYVAYGMECSIRDSDRELCQPGQQGVIWLRGKNVMLGYYNAPEATDDVLTADGWLNTGDLGYCDDQGRLFITGREKDLIVHKGIKIYPQEIENIIMEHPLVIRVAVIGQYDVNVGEVPIAFVQVKELSDYLVRELEMLCKKKCASYKVPRLFICTVDNLPLTSTSKIDKKALRQQIAGDTKKME